MMMIFMVMMTILIIMILMTILPLIFSWGKLMKNKKNNSASTFSDALEAMNEATGNGTGETNGVSFFYLFYC